VRDIWPPERTPRRRLLSDEEIALWVEVTRDVAPRPGVALPPRAAPPAIAPPPPQTPFLAPGAPPPRAAPSVPPLARLERRLKQNLLRGRTQVDGVIDLHGMRQHEAHHALVRFLHQAQTRRDRVVLVVTGKGRGGPMAGGPVERETGVLRRLAPHWLAAPELRGVIIGYEEAAQPHGGAGALYVRLRRADRGEDVR
jgi:DNA-nicking Smr family endonuclease